MATRPDPERFEQLYRDHRSAVYRYLLRDLRNREDAEDATQTAFLQAYRAYVGGTEPERPRAWLLTIAANLRRRRFRTRERRGEELPLDESLVEAPPSADEHVDELREALSTLPFNQRAALVLREVAGLSYAEIARYLSLSVGSVQMLLFRARRALRDELPTARRGLAALPTWLTNLVPSAERVAAVRVGGAATVAAAAAAMVVSGAEPDGRAADAEPNGTIAAASSPAPAAAMPTARRARVEPAAPRRPRAALAPTVRRSAPAPTAVVPPLPAATTEPRQPQSPLPIVSLPPASLPPALPPVPAVTPPTPTLPPLPQLPAAPPLELPLPPLVPPSELEGALGP